MIRVHKLGLIILIWLPLLACMTTVPKIPETSAPTLPTAIVVTSSSFTTPPSTSATANPGTGDLSALPTVTESEYQMRVRMSTTSDWTTFALIDGATWLQPILVSASSEATFSWLEDDRFLLAQPLERAEADGVVEMMFDFFITDLESGGTLVFEIERGHLGGTKVELFNNLDSEKVLLDTFEWKGINPGERNANTFRITAETLLNKAP